MSVVHADVPGAIGQASRSLEISKPPRHDDGLRLGLKDSLDLVFSTPIGHIQLATDITDPIVLITLGQTIVLTLTLAIFIYQFRGQNQAIKDAAYQKAMDDYTASISMLVERPELGRLIDELGRANAPAGAKTEGMAGEERAIFGYMLLNYSLFERFTCSMLRIGLTMTRGASGTLG